MLSRQNGGQHVILPFSKSSCHSIPLDDVEHVNGRVLFCWSLWRTMATNTKLPTTDGDMRASSKLGLAY